LFCSGLVVLSFFFKRQIWRLRKECWRLELRVQPCMEEELLREAEDEQILGVQRGSLGRASVVSARWGRPMGRLREERDDVTILFDSFTHIYLMFCPCFIHKLP
jgi:hypothetical protein